MVWEDERHNIWDIYAQKLYDNTIIDIDAPITSLVFTPYSESNIVIHNTQFLLAPTDGLGSGVSSIYYQINNSGWREYSGPFYLTGYSPNYYRISYYSIDNTGNVETIKSTIVSLINEEAGGDDITPNNDFPYLIGIIGGLSVLSIVASIGYIGFIRKHR